MKISINTLKLMLQRLFLQSLIGLLVLITGLPVFNAFANAPFLDHSLKGSKRVIMINPAGHAGDPGRSLNGFERAATFRFAQELQKAFEKNNDCRVVLTRMPGEKIVDFQNASFANRLNVDLFLSVHLFKIDSVRPIVYVYQHVTDPIGDFAQRSFQTLKIMPVMQAHQVNIFKSKGMGERLANVFSSSENQKLFDFGGFYGIPLKPLCGIVAPAILLEVGVNQDDDWQVVLDAVAQGLGAFV
jgi:N-acetylmuramoyl-L-alanine amidase